MYYIYYIYYCDSLHARLSSRWEAWTYKKKRYALGNVTSRDGHQEIMQIIRISSRSTLRIRK